MSTSSSSNITLPTEQERRQVFYWLKRLSSWTAWNRILGYYQAWADIAEASVREASDKGWFMKYDSSGEPCGGIPVVDVYDGVAYTSYTGTAIDESNYRGILKGLAHMEEGVRRLRKGDKRVFKYDANGEFVMADRPLSHDWELLNRIDLGETNIDSKHTPLWDEYQCAVKELSHVWGECGADILETNDPRDPARSIYGEWLINEFKKMTFPASLPDIPEPSENLFAFTGKMVPHSGIWEPVIMPKPKGLSLFKTASPPQGPLPITGCMNYLHGGSPAPKARVETQNDNPRIDVTWRLLWRDDRYEDGTIPAEEAGYVFFQPEAQKPVQPESTAAAPELTLAETGEAAPYAGRWLVEHELLASVTLGVGDPLPQHNGRDVRWVLAES